MGDILSDGKVSFNAQTLTLTLNGANINMEQKEGYPIESDIKALKVVLIGVDDNLRCEAEGFQDKVAFISETDTRRLPENEILELINLEGPLYISIDKDVMSEDECTTNWDQGSMRWTLLTSLLEAMLKQKVLGVDICGEEPKILTQCVYSLDNNINANFNESLYNLMKENIAR